MSMREMFHMLSAQATFMVVEGKKKKNSKNMIATINMDFQKYDCSIKKKFLLKKVGF